MNRESMQYVPPIVLAGMILLALTFGVLLLVEMRVILSIFFIGIVLGIGLSPMADYLTRYRIPRPISVMAVYSLVAGAIALFLWYAIPRIADEAQELFEESGEFAEAYANFAEDTPLPSLAEIESALGDFASGMGPAVAEQALVAFNVGLYFFSVLVIAIFYTVSKDRVFELTISLVAEEHRDRVSEVLDSMGTKLRRYLLAQFIAMIFVGLLTYLGLLALGVPFALVIGTLAFFLGVLPVIGATIAFSLAFVVALTQGLTIALLVAAYYVIIESIESYVLVPVVQRSQTQLPELLILGAILFGGALMGILGAIVALPAAVLIYILVMDVVVPWRRSQTGWAEAGDDAEARSVASGGG